MNKFSTSDALSFGFKTFFKNLPLYIGIWILFTISFYAIELLVFGTAFTFYPKTFSALLEAAGGGIRGFITILSFSTKDTIMLPKFIKTIIGFLLIPVVTIFYVSYIKTGLELHDQGKSFIKTFYNNLPGKLRSTGFTSLSFVLIILIIIILTGLCLLLPFVVYTLTNNVILLILSLILPITCFILMYLRLGFAPYLVIDQNLNPITSIRQSWQLTEGSISPLFSLSFINSFIAATIFLLPIATLANIHAYRSLLKQNT